MASEVKKEYQKGDLTVVWQPGKCIHSAVCVKTLPDVYKPNEKPWINPENASIEELKAQISKCPSGALSYREANEGGNKMETQNDFSIELTKNGPMLVKGEITLQHSDGKIEKRENMTAFCRCGASGNKPFCDGSHRNTGFEG